MTKIRESAKDEDCQIKLRGVCSRDSRQTVWAHSNRGADGKGMGLKARDEKGAYACYSCHSIYDRQQIRPKGMTLEYVENAFTEAMERSRLILIEKGLIDEA
jgi:hypothetical protein